MRAPRILAEARIGNRLIAVAISGFETTEGEVPWERRAKEVETGELLHQEGLPQDKAGLPAQAGEQEGAGKMEEGEDA